MRQRLDRSPSVKSPPNELLPAAPEAINSPPRDRLVGPVLGKPAEKRSTCQQITGKIISKFPRSEQGEPALHSTSQDQKRPSGPLGNLRTRESPVRGLLVKETVVFPEIHRQLFAFV